MTVGQRLMQFGLWLPALVVLTGWIGVSYTQSFVLGVCVSLGRMGDEAVTLKTVNYNRYP